jgi:hypothetical protein
MEYKSSFARHVERRIFRLHQAVRLDTVEIRNKWITELDNLFDMATSIAKGEITQQEVDGKMQTITPKERQMWAQLAANIANAMGNLTKAYHEEQIDKDLDKLESYMEEIRAKREKEAKENSATKPSAEI